ncbi:MAG: hypothetical protein V2A56_12970 [bacterium]
MSSAAWKQLLFASLLVTSTAQAQEADSLLLRFHQELNTRSLRFFGGWFRSSSDWIVDTQGRTEITERTLPKYEPQWKSDVGFDLSAQRLIAPGWTAVLESDGQDFHDSEASLRIDLGSEGSLPLVNALPTTPLRPVTGQNSRISRAAIRGGTRWEPDRSWQVSLLGGSAMDRQLEGSGEGFSGRAEVGWSDPDNALTRIQGSGWIDSYGDRRQQETSASATTERTIGDAEDHLSAHWQNRRYDLFLGAENNVVRRISEETRVDNRLTTPLNPNNWGIYNLGYRRSTVDYQGGGPGRSYELDLINQVAIRGYRGPYDGTLSYGYNIEDRKYAGNLILGRRQVLAMDAGWGSARQDSLRLYASTQKLMFDSPDTLETSDHDRLIHRVVVRSILPIGESTRVLVEGLVVLDHLVYINADRSSENRWNRVFRMIPSVEWVPAPGWRNCASFEILANYTAYDFEDVESGEVRSNVLRRWSAADTLRFPAGQMLTLESTVRYDLEDRGRLRWVQFQQELSDEIHAVYLSAAIQRNFIHRTSLKTGYRIQRRYEDRYLVNPAGGTQRTRSRTYLVYGPFLRIQTGWGNPLRLIIDTNLQKVEDSAGRGPARLDRIDISLVYQW